MRATAWLDQHPVALVVFWEPGEHAATRQRPAYRTLLEIVKAAVRERHPQLTQIPGHDHGDLFCFAWSGCFRFIADSAMVQRVREALIEEAESRAC